jgi:hypothetical protein
LACSKAFRNIQADRQATTQVCYLFIFSKYSHKKKLFPSKSRRFSEKGSESIDSTKREFSNGFIVPVLSLLILINNNNNNNFSDSVNVAVEALSEEKNINFR